MKITAPLPLRTTSVWAGFRSAQPIPHRYGSTGGACLQYDDARTMFVWADHPVQAIDDVLVGGQVVTNWVFANAVDSTGRAVAMLTFDAPVDEGADVVARGRGKLHPTAGRPMTNPADVVWDILANLAGRPVTESSLDAFRRACDVAEIIVGGSITKADRAIDVVREICLSIGAVFCPDMDGLCRLWPGSDPGPARWTAQEGDVSAAADSAELANDLTLQYAHEDGEARAAMRLDAPGSVALYGLSALVIDAPWVNSARVAAEVGTRILQHRARPQWTVTAKPTKLLNVGDAIALDHPMLPVSGTFVILARDANLDSDEAGCTATVRAPAGDVPIIRLVSQSTTFDPEQYASVQVDTQGGDRVLTLRDDAPGNPPLVGASVTLDGTITRQTDGTGRVSFPAASMPPGNHTLDIVTADGRTMTVTVLVQ